MYWKNLCAIAETLYFVTKETVSLDRLYASFHKYIGKFGIERNKEINKNSLSNVKLSKIL